MPYIYLIKAHNSGGLHKIGKTIDINRRMRELMAGPSNQVEILEVPTTDAMDTIEKGLHRQFADVRVPQSEMFNLSPEQVTACCEAMNHFRVEFAPTPEELAEKTKRKALHEAERNRVLIPLKAKIRDREKAIALANKESNKFALYVWGGLLLASAVMAGPGVFFLLLLTTPFSFHVIGALFCLFYYEEIRPLQLTEQEKYYEPMARKALRDEVLGKWKNNP